MNQLTPDARLRLDLYLTGVRRAVTGTSVDPAEVERDIRDHIDSALRNADSPVSRATLDEVLTRLGEPTQWIPDDELPAWRRIWRRVAFGPEEWRLPYLSLALTVLGLILIPVGVGLLLILAAWFVSRAALELPAMRTETDAARKWLLYPPIVFLSIDLAVLILIGPAVPLLAWGIEQGGIETVLEVDTLSRADHFLLYTGWVLASFAVWWIALAGLIALFIRPLQWLFYPLAKRMRRAHAIVLASLAIVMGIGGVALLSRYVG